MSKFVLTAQLQLQAPTNTRQVINQLRGQLQGAVNIPVNVQGSVQATKQINQVNQAAQKATTAGERMGKAFGASIKRFAAFNIATRAVGLLASKLSSAVDEAIEFQRELVKISQVTGKTTGQLSGLTKEITRLSTTLGVSSTALLQTTRVLAQAGIQAGDLKVALEALAKTTLAPTFDDITETAEGAVAILAQFGQGVGALEKQLGAINAVSKQFAVESGDLISSVRRMGGVFKSAGGNLNELIGLFTSVRATTRENAESIATGLRTIFTRIQRPTTIAYLKDLGVELTDVSGKFVGPFEAIKRLSQAFADIPAGDLKFVQIAEELGGFRQIGKVIPLIQQFELAERARQAAVEGGNSLNKDAATAQEALAVQIEKTREKFLALIRGISETASFQIMIKSLLGIADAFISIAEAIKPLIPLITVFAGIKLAKGLGTFASGIGAGLRGKNQGGKIHAFASGGFVPGTGNRDTVPAMLTPGEFVIRKSSVNKIGAGTLAAMNENKYADGGLAKSTRIETSKLRKSPKFSGSANLENVGKVDKISDRIQNIPDSPDDDTFGGAFLSPEGSIDDLKGFVNKSAIEKELKKSRAYVLLKGAKSGSPLKKEFAEVTKSINAKKDFRVVSEALQQTKAEAVEESIFDGVLSAVQSGAALLSESSRISEAGAERPKVAARLLRSANIDNVIGNLYEGILTNAGVPYSEKDRDAANATFDYPAGLGRVASNFGEGNRLKNIKTDAKTRFTTNNIQSLIKKVKNNEAERLTASLEDILLDPKTLASIEQVNANFSSRASGTEVSKAKQVESFRRQRGVEFAASGGSISGSDTVPAMLTPGEFVINKKASQSIGYGNLNKMNKQGVVGFASGGPVGVQKFASGGDVGGGGMGALGGGMLALTGALATLQGVISTYGDKSLDASDSQAAATIAAESTTQALTVGIIGFIATLKASQGIQKKILTTDNKLVNAILGAPEKDSDSGGGGGDGGGAGGGAGGVAEEEKKKTKTKSSDGGDGVDKTRKMTKQEARNLLQTTIKLNKRAKNRLAWDEKNLAASQKNTAATMKQIAPAQRLAANAQAAENKAKGMLDTIGKHQKTYQTLLTTAQGRVKYSRELMDANKLEADLTDQAVQESKEKLALMKKGQTQLRKQNAKIRSDAQPAITAAGADVATAKARVNKLTAERKSVSAKQRALAGPQVQRNLETRRGRLATTTNEAANLRRRIQDAEKRGQTQLQRGKSAGGKGGKGGEHLDAARKRLVQLETAAKKDATVIAKVTKATEELANRQAALKQETKKAKGEVTDLVAKERNLINSRDKAQAAVSENIQALTRERNKEKAVLTGLVDKQKKLQATGSSLKQNHQKLVDTESKHRNSLNLANRAAAKHTGHLDRIQRVRLKAETRLSKAINLWRAQGKVVTNNAKLVETSNKRLVAIAKLQTKANNVLWKSERKLTAARKKGSSAANAAAKPGRGKQPPGSQPPGGQRSSRRRRDLGSLASAGTAVSGGVMTGVMMAQQVFSGLNEMFERDVQLATRGGDAGSAMDAQRSSEQMKARMKGFSLAGFVELLAIGPEEFKRKQKEEARSNIASTGLQVLTQKNAQVLQQLQDPADTKFRDEGTKEIDFEKAGIAIARDTSGVRSAISKVSNEAEREKMTQELNKSLRESIIGFAEQGASMEDAERMIKNVAGGNEQLAKSLRDAAKAAIAVREAQMAVAKANFDSLKITSTFNAANTALKNFVSSIDGSTSGLDRHLATLQESQRSLGVDASEAITGIRDDLMEALPEGSEGRKLIERQSEKALEGNQFSLNVEKNLKGLELNRSSAEVARDELTDSLIAAAGGANNITPEIKRIIDAEVGKINEKNVATTDLSAVISNVKGQVGQLSKGFMEAAKAFNESNKIILQLTQRRRAAELQYIAAQKQSIATQLEAAKIIEEFGGEKVTPEDRKAASIAQFNLTATDAGVAGLTTGSGEDIANVGNQIATALQNQIAKGATPGGFGSQTDRLSGDRRKELQDAQKELINFAKQRAVQLKEELEIVQKKNKLEKDSLEKAISGDFEGFLKGQAAAGAASAIRSGNQNLLGLFGGEAISTAFQDAKSQGLPPEEFAKFAKAAAASAGITDSRAVGVLSGSTAEEQRIMEEGRRIGEAMGGVAQQTAEVANMQVEAAQVVINAATVKRDDTLTNMATRFAGGGPVYANRGIFVPRGTDTVPAMLTPGEFVVNRASVQRGNNLAILQAMNNGQQAAGPAMNRGGSVRYYSNGSDGGVQPGGGGFGISPETVTSLNNAFSGFSTAVDKLVGMQLSVKLDATNVNVNFSGTSFLANLTDTIRTEVLAEVRNQIPNIGLNLAGDPTFNQATV